MCASQCHHRLQQQRHVSISSHVHTAQSSASHNFLRYIFLDEDLSLLHFIRFQVFRNRTMGWMRDVFLVWVVLFFSVICRRCSLCIASPKSRNSQSSLFHQKTAAKRRPVFLIYFLNVT
jgi:hypothetical protein